MIPPEMLALMLQQVLSTDEGRENAATSIAAFLTQLGITDIVFVPTVSHPATHYTANPDTAARVILDRIAALTD